MSCRWCDFVVFESLTPTPSLELVLSPAVYSCKHALMARMLCHERTSLKTDRHTFNTSLQYVLACDVYICIALLNAPTGEEQPDGGGGGRDRFGKDDSDPAVSRGGGVRRRGGGLVSVPCSATVKCLETTVPH